MSKKLAWETRKVKVSELIKLEFNPRKITEEKRKKLIESLEKFNLVEIPAVNTDMKIIGGNQRVTALMLAGRGDEEIDVRYPNRKLTDKEVKEYCIISNTHAGEFDFEMLELDFADINIADIGFNLEGFDAWETAKEKEAKKLEAKEDDYDVPDGGMETDIVLGDLFEIGEHRLLCGDSTDSDSVAKLMNGEKADMVFTDPPYGISIVNSNSKKVGGCGVTKFGKVGGSKIVDAKTYSQIIGDDTTDTARNFYNTCISLGMTNFILWGGNYFTDFLPPSMCWIVWDKENTGNFADVELAWTSYDKAAKLYKWLWNGMSRKGARNIEGKTRVHPTQKPVGLFNDIFKDFEFNSCFDGFGGSGSTMVTCEQLNKKCYMIEMSENYCQVIIDRMIKLNPELIIKRNGELWNTPKKH